MFKHYQPQKNIRDSLINSMAEGVVGINDHRDIILSNKMADEILPTIDQSMYERIEDQIEDTFTSKGTEFREYDFDTRYYVFIMSYIPQIQEDGRSGIVVIIRDMTNEHNLDQMKKISLLMFLMNCVHLFHYYKDIQNQLLTVSLQNQKKLKSHYQLS